MTQLKMNVGPLNLSLPLHAIGAISALLPKCLKINLLCRDKPQADCCERKDSFPCKWFPDFLVAFEKKT